MKASVGHIENGEVKAVWTPFRQYDIKVTELEQMMERDVKSREGEIYE